MDPRIWRNPVYRQTDFSHGALNGLNEDFPGGDLIEGTPDWSISDPVNVDPTSNSSFLGAIGTAFGGLFADLAAATGAGASKAITGALSPTTSTPPSTVRHTTLLSPTSPYLKPVMWGLGLGALYLFLRRQ